MPRLSVSLRTAAVLTAGLSAAVALLAPGYGRAAAVAAVAVQQSPRPAVLAASGSPGGHFNVGNSHSPQLLSRLAGPVRAAVRTTTTASLARGVDVASYQHPNGAAIDWTAVAAAGYKFAFVKATEGSYYTNPYFASDYAAAKAAGLAVAGYHFANPADSGGTLQADYAVTTAGYAPDGRTLPLVLDIEYNPYGSECYGLTPAAMVAWITAFTAEVTRRTGRPPIIYTAAGWWNTCTAASHAFAGSRLWIAAYSVSSPPLPAGWSTWEFWQYTSTATVSGIDDAGHTDVSYLSAAMVTMLAQADQSGTVGTGATRTVTALGDTGILGMTYSATGLPHGMTIDAATGVITGTWPVTAQSGTATITATPPSGPAGSTTYAWHAHGPVSLSDPGARSSVSRSPVAFPIQAADGLPGCTLTFSATGLPQGLTMTTCGAISGWISSTGRYHVTVRVTDSTGAPLASIAFTWTVGPASWHGPVGPIVLAGTRRCIQVPATLSATGTPVTAQPCDGRSHQAWTTAASGMLRISGKCLDGGTVLGSTAKLVTCVSTATQGWENVPGTGLVNDKTGGCLQDPGSTTGTVLKTTACQGIRSQQWITPPAPLVSGVPGQCATGIPQAPPRQYRVSLRPCGTLSAQAWTTKPDHTLAVLGRCLTAPLTSAGTLLTLAACTGSPAQQWVLFGHPLGAQLVNPLAGLCLGRPAVGSTATTPLALEPCDSRPGTNWHIN